VSNSAVTVSSDGYIQTLDAEAAMQNYAADFEAFSKARAKDPLWLRKLREEGFAAFQKLGFPTMRDEDWHFTNIAPVAERTFSLAKSGKVPPAEIEHFRLRHEEWNGVVLINGVFSRELSTLNGIEKGVTVRALSEGMSDIPSVAEELIGKVAAADAAFTALNAAFMQDAVLIDVSRNAVVNTPIHIMHVNVGINVRQAAHPRIVISCAENSKAVVIESFFSNKDSEYLTNAVTEVALAEGSHLAHYKLQRESTSGFHVGTTVVRQGRTSNYVSFSFATGAALSRTNIYTVLDGEAATCTLNGLYMVDGKQHVDHQTKIEHVQPHCPSHEVYKGILDGESHGVFNGKVYVHPEAQKTDGKQSNNNLLLSDKARIDTKPQLEIFADDVKCTHGATVGRLDEVALFYMKSRGIGDERARQLLTYAFAADVLEMIELDELREALEAMVLHRFTKQLGD
jgi:Fe-S cluster assembly protein SufD